MLDIIFTLDYEIYGNGMGNLRDLVYEPTRQLTYIFKQWNSKFVVFAEAAEFEAIEKYHADDAISSIRAQLRQLYDDGFEIGLHLHPQWSKAYRDSSGWHLNPNEYNLCTLSPQRVNAIVTSSIAYLRELLSAPNFVPQSFRAGNWLFHPTKNVSEVLSAHGVRIDTSVFKGGRQRSYSLDYRPAMNNGYYWSFRDDVNTPDPNGVLVEIPIYTDMLPFWKMFSWKRFAIQKRNHGFGINRTALNRLLDLARFSYPRKLDFCRMTYEDLRSVMEIIILEDQLTPMCYKPIVAIGHSKDQVDFDTVQRFLSYLNIKGIAISNFNAVLQRLHNNRA